jgi:hypothetical protein
VILPQPMRAAPRLERDIRPSWGGERADVRLGMLPHTPIALVSAPTGSGKTLTAFLWAIDSLVTGRLATGAARQGARNPSGAVMSITPVPRMSPLVPADVIRGRTSTSWWAS